MKSKYLLESERLGFRNWNAEDLDEFAKINSDESVMKHFPKTLTRNETGDFIKRLQAHFDRNGYNYFAVEIKGSMELIGFIGLANQDYETDFMPATDIGWRLKSSAWGKGYATEGAKRCLEFAFSELKLDRIVSTCTIANKNSENVMKKIGMIKKGEFLHPKLSEFPNYEKCIWYEIKNTT